MQHVQKYHSALPFSRPVIVRRALTETWSDEVNFVLWAALKTSQMTSDIFP